MSTSSDHDQFKHCFREWIAQSQQDLSELLETLSLCPKNNEKLVSLAEKSTKHFEDYAENRKRLAKQDGPSFLSPPWCTTFENSSLWIGGCRPSLCIRLVYSLCGVELEGRLCTYFDGERKGDLVDISADQLNLISALQVKTVKEEDKLSTHMATLQDDIADSPLIDMAQNSSRVGEMSSDVDKAMDAHALSLSTMLIAADKLRIITTKELLGILTPLQRIHFLVAAKKLHLSIHEWAIKRDENHGKTSLNYKY